MRAADVHQIISSHRYKFEKPPTQTPADHSIDAPLLGNGDLGVAIGGTACSHRYLIAKNDFWKLRKGRRFGGGPAPIGDFTLEIRDLFRTGSYCFEQKIYEGVTTGAFEAAARSIRTKSWVAATENLAVIEIRCEGEATAIDTELRIAGGRGSESECTCNADAIWGRRAFAHMCEIESGAAIAVGCISSTGRKVFDIRSITIEPGETIVYTIAVCSNFDDAEYADAAKRRADEVKRSALASIEDLWHRHREWWKGFWEMSCVNIDDPLIEKQYYLSQYILASASRNPAFPPSIFGTWITTDDPWWMGDYHLNYNHMAPYYGLYSSNHIEQAAPYEAPILDFMDRGTFYAREQLGVRGVYYPVGIGPKGVETTWDSAAVDHLAEHYDGDGLFFGQKSNAAYAVVNMSMRWFATYDIEYARTVYPFVNAVAQFWEDYLTWEAAGERFISTSDAIHEGSGSETNPILSLGLIRCVMRTVVDMSRELGVDEERQAGWQKILDNVSEYPVYERNGKRIFRLTEEGVDWWDDNTLAIQHIYPAGEIGPADDPELLQISRNTIEETDRWNDANGMNSYYPAAVRVGYDPEVILAKLREHCQSRLHPNGFTIDNPHGIETCSTVPNTINEMLCLSQGGIIRLFFNWPRDRNASFSTLRAHGAFLVSSSLEYGDIGHVRIVSERGRTCRIMNPWPNEPAVLRRSDGAAEKLSGKFFEVPTRPGESFALERSGQ